MLQEGDIIELQEGDHVYADIPEHFCFGNRRGSFELTHHEARIGGELDYLAGRYVVYKTTYDGGGGTEMGHHIGYPNGHHVFCEKLDDPKVKVDFYQSGCFSAMIENIKPVAKAVRRWVEG
ncbi:MAG: hypothetical protein A4E65_01156 [Syntrophorhabdus sp. PtaU1.Bin153]|nr:MAG: hypothetical protein A4E65_01156 [Syntrophorhabdus sp. PtaU1.Bin153]